MDRSGRELILATASDSQFARQVADHLDLFIGVIASDGNNNLDGSRKLHAILAQSNVGGFDYMGNARADLPLWAASREAYVVDPPRRISHLVHRQSRVVKEFTVPHKRFRACVRAMRLHQWLKNLLVFVPLLAGHHWQQYELIEASLLAFLAFGLAASSGYWINDLLDLEADRQHPEKHTRPFASGALPLHWGMAGIPVMVCSAVLLALLLPWQFMAALAAYYALTLLYSLFIKRIVMLDVTVLALLYTLRILGGAAATGIVPSFWLLAFSLFLFLGLAIVKRYTELLLLQGKGRETVLGRGYQAGDLGLLGMLGISSGFLSVLVMALYINSNSVSALYTQPELIWFLCPLLVYWNGYIWFQAHRGKMHHDPVVFAARDPVSWLVAGLAGLVLLIAR